MPFSSEGQLSPRISYTEQSTCRGHVPAGSGLFLQKDAQVESWLQDTRPPAEEV